VECTWTYE